MFVHVHCPKGNIVIDGEYGNIVEINGEWEPGKAPKHFLVSEYRTHYGVSTLPDKLDIRDLSYTSEDDQHVPASESWRKALKTTALVPTVSLERLADTSIKALQEERDNHPGGPWRKDPVADFLVGLSIRSCYGHLLNHAEILAAENAVLRAQLAEAQKQIEQLR